MWSHHVEQLIEQAVKDGVFDGLPGRGRPSSSGRRDEQEFCYGSGIVPRLN